MRLIEKYVDMIVKSSFCTNEIGVLILFLNSIVV